MPPESGQYPISPVPVQLILGPVQSEGHLSPYNACWRHLSQRLWVLLQHLCQQLYVLVYVGIEDKFALCLLVSPSTLLIQNLVPDQRFKILEN